MTIKATETTAKTPNGKITKANDIVAIARAAYEAYVAKNRAAIEKLIAADFLLPARWITGLIARLTLRVAGRTANGSTASPSLTSCPIVTGSLLPTKVTAKMASASGTQRL